MPERRHDRDKRDAPSEAGCRLLGAPARISRAAWLILGAKPLFFLAGLPICAVLSRVLEKREKAVRDFATGLGREQQGGAASLTMRAARAVNGYLRYMAILTGRIPSHRLRMLCYRKVFRLKAERRVVIYGGAEIRAAYKISIGEGSIIGDDAKLDGRRGISIGKNVNLSTGVWMWTLEHDAQCPRFSCGEKGGPVIVGDRSWLSARTMILPNTTIGEATVVAAGSVVNKDLEPFSIYAGVPARKVSERNRDLIYEFDGSHLPFL